MKRAVCFLTVFVMCISLLGGISFAAGGISIEVQPSSISVRGYIQYRLVHQCERYRIRRLYI